MAARSCGLLCLCVVALLPGLAPGAERLPTRNFTTADGLAGNYVNCVFQDSRGYMWFCTDQGLSRYDGYGFTNYGMDQGLPDRSV